MSAKFTKFSGVDVQRFFSTLRGFEQMDHRSLGASEWVFRRRVFLPAADLQLSLQVYTTVTGSVEHPEKAFSRDIGTDAIRVILFWGEIIVDYVKHAEIRVPRYVSHVDVKRTQGWRKGIATAVNHWEELIGPPCPYCHKPTGRRDGPHGSFYGCVDFKDHGCRGTHKSKVIQLNCSSCNGMMVERNGPHGKFLGCNQYPRCRHTEAA